MSRVGSLLCSRALLATFLSGFVVLLLARTARAADWPGSFISRVEALALVQTLNAEILASRSATFTLQKWCTDHHLAGAAEPTIVARLLRGQDKPATPEQRQRLDVAPDETLKFRHVQLLCGDRVLSEADNWYVPGRLAPEMNHLLETTTTPFGAAVQDLKPYRRTFAATVLWRPLPEGWETRPTISATQESADHLSIPDALFEHRAVLYTKNGKPFSEVDEVYQRALLDFRPPAP
jgi:hypothetical protein